MFVYLFFFINFIFRYKQLVAQAIIEKFTPIRQEIIKLMNSPEYLSQVLQDGQLKANSIALKTWQEVASKIGTVTNSNIGDSQLFKDKN